MKTIHRYNLPAQDIAEVAMPEGAEILTIQYRGDQCCIWAIVDDDPGTKFVARKFRVAGTGHPLLMEGIEEKDLKFINTFQMYNGELIFHVFEIIK